MSCNVKNANKGNITPQSWGQLAPVFIFGVIDACILLFLGITLAFIYLCFLQVLYVNDMKVKEYLVNSMSTRMKETWKGTVAVADHHTDFTRPTP